MDRCARPCRTVFPRRPRRAGHPLISLLGEVATHDAFASMRAGRVTAVSVATVADLAVLGVDSAGGLCADRPFGPGEIGALQ